MTGGLASAVSTWFRSAAGGARLRGVCCVLVLGLLCAVAGALSTRRWAPRVVTRTETKLQVQTVEHQVVVEKPVIRWRDRTVTVTKYAPSGSVSETIVSKTDSGEKKEGTVTTTDEKVAVKEESKETKTPEQGWAVWGGPGIGLEGLSVTAGATKRLVGPVGLGVAVHAPLRAPQNTDASVIISFSW